MRPTGSARLLVEGPDDKWAVISLISQVWARSGKVWDQVPWRPDVQDKGGVDQVLEALGVMARSTPVLGVIVDADEDRDARWCAVRDRLRREGLTVPDFPQDAGWVGAGFLPNSRVGVWLMPDNRLRGTLEDLLALLVPADDAHWPHATEAVRCAVERDASAHNAAWHSKARIHTWLAWQDHPGQPFGTAITARVLSRTDAPEAMAFVSWFERLYQP